MPLVACCACALAHELAADQAGDRGALATRQQRFSMIWAADQMLPLPASYVMQYAA